MTTIEENILALQAKLEETQKLLFEKQEQEREEKSWEYNIEANINSMKISRLTNDLNFLKTIIMEFTNFLYQQSFPF